MTAFHLWMDVIQRQMIGVLTTIGTPVIPVFLNGLSPHALSFTACHGLKEKKVLRRIFERHCACCGGLLLFLREPSLHVGVGFWGNGRLFLGTGSASCFTLVDVGVKTRRFSVAFVHFFVDLPL